MAEQMIPKHINFDYCEMGLGASLSNKEVNEIIEEIILLLISKKVTVKLAKEILEDAISSIDKEAFLEKRIIGGEIK